MGWIQEPVTAARARSAAAIGAGALAFALPLVGLLSLLLRSQLDPHLESYRAHFVVFGLVGGIAFGLGFAAGEAAGVLIGAETFDQLPEGAVVEERRGLRVKGKHDVVNAYVLLALP